MRDTKTYKMLDTMVRWHDDGSSTLTGQISVLHTNALKMYNRCAARTYINKGQQLYQIMRVV